jgi:hypothetical protein
MAIPSKFPVRVRAGSVTVKIYRSKNSKNYLSYVVVHSVGSKKHVQTFGPAGAPHNASGREQRGTNASFLSFHMPFEGQFLSAWLRKIGVSRVTGYRWIKQDRIKAVSIYGRRYISNEEIERFFTEGAQFVRNRPKSTSRPKEQNRDAAVEQTSFGPDLFEIAEASFRDASPAMKYAMVHGFRLARVHT